MTVPSDYGKADGFNRQKALEMCPHCETIWSMNGGMQGPAFEQDGTQHEIYIDANPEQGPFFCESCFAELETNRKQQSNKPLTEF